VGTHRDTSQQVPAESRWYLSAYWLGVAAFVLAFALGMGYSLSSDHNLPGISGDFGLDRLDRSRDADQLIRELEMYLQIGPVGDVLRPASMAEYRVELGRLWQAKGRTSEAADNYQQALALYPYAPYAHYELGRIELERGNAEQAFERFMRELQVNGGHAPSHFELGRIYERHERPADAMYAFENAVHFDARLWAAHLALGRLRGNQQDWPTAAWHFLQVLEAEPDNADAHYGLGSALLATGQREKATRHLQEAARLRPDWQPPREQLRRLDAGTAPEPSPN
jgi:tetratricopeptide (TPR) repeat protein